MVNFGDAYMLDVVWYFLTYREVEAQPIYVFAS